MIVIQIVEVFPSTVTQRESRLELVQQRCLSMWREHYRAASTVLIKCIGNYVEQPKHLNVTWSQAVLFWSGTELLFAQTTLAVPNEGVEDQQAPFRNNRVEARVVAAATFSLTPVLVQASAMIESFVMQRQTRHNGRKGTARTTCSTRARVVTHIPSRCGQHGYKGSQ